MVSSSLRTRPGGHFWNKEVSTQGECEMEVLIVNFELQGMTEAEYYRQCDEIAPAFADVPGLASKIWLADASTNTFGGVYVFVDADARDAFLASDLFKQVGATPGLANFVVRP